MVRSRFVFEPWQTPHAQEKCIARTKARRVWKVAELIDLYWDGEPKDRSLDQAAGVPVPARWLAASFLAHKKNCDWDRNISEEVV
jgi:hypothetical protein